LKRLGTALMIAVVENEGETALQLPMKKIVTNVIPGMNAITK